MSMLSALAPAIAPVANSVALGPGSPAREADAGSMQKSNAGNVLASQAAVVTLSFDSKRAASSGDGKRVDAGFEKQEVNGNSVSAKRQEAKEEVQNKLDVSA